MMRNRARHIPVVAVVCFFVAFASGQEKKPAPKAEKDSGTTVLRIEVTGGEKNEPVEGASVYVKYVHERLWSKDKKIEMNVKTNREGVAKVPEVPRGKILVQVIASGWRTFGRWYDATQEQQTIKIKLERPTKWY
jgi:hypothetical protein